MKFYEGIQSSAAFSHYMTEDGRFLSGEQPDYQLFESCYFPFTVFEDELRALNDYCHMVVCSVTEQFETAKTDVNVQKNEQEEIGDTYSFFTPYEVMMGLETQLYKWEWIYDITAAHLVILLHSFLEKTLKHLHSWFLAEKIIEPTTHKQTSKVFAFIYALLGTNEDGFIRAHPRTYSVLEAARRMRNHFAHDNLEGSSLVEDYVYANRKNVSAFRLIDLFTAISEILSCVEDVYKRYSDHTKPIT